MTTEKERLEAAIGIYRFYRKRADECWDLYRDINQAYFMFEYNIEMAKTYEQVILAFLWE